MIPENLTWDDLGHYDESPAQAFGPDYVISDLGKGLDLTCTVLGYQLDEEGAIKLIHGLQGFIDNCRINKLLESK